MAKTLFKISSLCSKKPLIGPLSFSRFVDWIRSSALSVANLNLYFNRLRRAIYLITWHCSNNKTLYADRSCGLKLLPNAERLDGHHMKPEAITCCGCFWFRWIRLMCYDILSIVFVWCIWFRIEVFGQLRLEAFNVFGMLPDLNQKNKEFLVGCFWLCFCIDGSCCGYSMTCCFILFCCVVALNVLLTMPHVKDVVSVHIS